MSNRPQTHALTEHSHHSLNVKTLQKICSTDVIGTKLASIREAFIRASAAKICSSDCLSNVQSRKDFTPQSGKGSSRVPNHVHIVTVKGRKVLNARAGI